MTGYARLTVNGVFHRWVDHNMFYLAAKCERGSLLPRAGAKLKKREEVPADAICKQCERKEGSDAGF